MKAPDAEWFCLSGALVGLLLFSLSSFQLPHYVNILFPFFSVISAQYLIGRYSKGNADHVVMFMQQFTLVIVLVLPIVLFILVQPFPVSFDRWILFIPLAGILIWLAYGTFSAPQKWRVILQSVLVVLFFNLFLNLIFYPFLLKYQSGSEAAFWVNEHFPKTALVQNDEGAEAYAFEFYAGLPVSHKPARKQDLPVILYTSVEKVPGLKKQGYQITVLKSFTHFHISKLNGQFLNKDTRPGSLKEYQLIRMDAINH